MNEKELERIFKKHYLDMVDVLRAGGTYGTYIEATAGEQGFISSTSSSELPEMHNHPDIEKVPQMEAPREYVVLPPKDTFINNLLYMLDLADANDAQRRTMKALIKKFEKNGHGKTSTTNKKST